MTANKTSNNHELKTNSLVIYKAEAAIVQKIDKKITIQLRNGDQIQARTKDVQLIHPGPVNSFSTLEKLSGDIQTAWELLAGSQTNLQELCELIYENYSPASALAVYQLLEDGSYFHGSIEIINVRSQEEIEQREAEKAAKEAEKQAWNEFVERVRKGIFQTQDQPHLAAVEKVATGKTEQAKLLAALNLDEKPETAHKLLLKLGYWDHSNNPYPERFNVHLTAPELSLNAFPDEERIDLTHLPAYAIDDEHSDMPDDALSLEDNRLWIHIADPAAAIFPDSPIDLAARERGESLYLPEKIIDMLPNDAVSLFSLGNEQRSPALSFAIDLDTEGNPASLEIIPSWIHVTRTTYTNVETQIDKEPFRQLYEIAQAYQQSRNNNGALSIDLPEIIITAQNGIADIKPLPRSKSRAIVSAAMIMAGESLAKWAIEKEIPFPFTTNDSPNLPQPEDKLSENFAIRRKLRRSQYKTTPAPHNMLGLQAYTQVTSPLRRYLDMVAHQQIRAYLHNQPLLDTNQIVERVGAVEAVTNSVRSAERLSEQHWTLVYLMQHPDWQGDSILVEKRNLRGKILIPELALETEITLTEDLPLDTNIPLIVKQIDLPRLKAYFNIKTG